MKRPTNNRGVRTHKVTHKSNQNNIKTKLINIKSINILSKIFNNLVTKTKLIFIQHNKNLQEKLNISLNDYKKESKIIIELFPINLGKSNNENIFLNYLKEEDKPYYHIYFNDNENEVKKNIFKKEENITKIKIIIDNEIYSLKGLFSNCICIKKIAFIKFSRKNIIDMSYMFYNIPF